MSQAMTTMTMTATTTKESGGAKPQLERDLVNATRVLFEDGLEGVRGEWFWVERVVLLLRVAVGPGKNPRKRTVRVLDRVGDAPVPGEYVQVYVLQEPPVEALVSLRGGDRGSGQEGTGHRGPGTRTEPCEGGGAGARRSMWVKTARYRTVKGVKCPQDVRRDWGRWSAWCRENVNRVIPAVMCGMVEK